MSEETAIIYYRALLEKYITHVVDTEGTDFLNDWLRDAGGSTVSFTDEEWAELQELSGREG